MKIIILAIALTGLMVNAADPSTGFAGFTVSDTSFGPGGHLQDSTPQDLTDCCGNSLSPR